MIKALEFFSRRLFLSAGLIVILFSGISCTSADPRDRSFNLSIVDQKLVNQDSNLTVNQDDRVNIVINSDKNVLFHLHGYDIEKLVKAGEPTEIDFTAKASGSFPFTIHESESTEEHESHENASHGHHEDGHEEVSVAEDELELGRLDVLPN